MHNHNTNFCNSSILNAVCETSYEDVVVMEDVAKCESISVTNCIKDPESGEEVCKDWPRQVCKVEKQRQTKTVPSTECSHLPRRVCGPALCPLVKKDPVCEDRVRMFVQQVPEEKCEMIPQEACNQVSKLIPFQEAIRQCSQVPKEICSQGRGKPKEVKVARFKKWCQPRHGGEGESSFILE